MICSEKLLISPIHKPEYYLSFPKCQDIFVLFLRIGYTYCNYQDWLLNQHLVSVLWFSTELQ